jgi:hypothetical protein
MAHVDSAEGYLARVTFAGYDQQNNRFEELLRKAVEASPSQLSGAH